MLGFLGGNAGPRVLKKWSHIRVAPAGARNAQFADPVCNGNGDDADINQALADTQSGGKVELVGDGYFDIRNRIVFPDTPSDRVGITLHGGGICNRSTAIVHPEPASRLLVNAAFDDDYVIELSNNGGTERAFCHTLYGFSIDGNGQLQKASGGPITGIYNRMHRGVIERVQCTLMSGYGMETRGFAGGSVTGDNSIEKCVFEYNVLGGALINEYGSDSFWEFNVIRHNGANPGDAPGFHIIGGANNYFFGNNYYRNLNALFYDHAGTYNKHYGEKIENSDQHAVLVRSTDTRGINWLGFHGCNIRIVGIDDLGSGPPWNYDAYHFDIDVAGRCLNLQIDSGAIHASTADWNVLPAHAVNFLGGAAALGVQRAMVSNLNFAETALFGTAEMNYTLAGGGNVKSIRNCPPVADV